MSRFNFALASLRLDVCRAAPEKLHLFIPVGLKRRLSFTPGMLRHSASERVGTQLAACSARISFCRICL